MAKEVIVKNLNLVGMTDYFNEIYKKKDGGKFSYWNIRAYAVKGKVPSYLGEGLRIVPCVPIGSNVRLWKLVRETK